MSGLSSGRAGLAAAGLALGPVWFWTAEAISAAAWIRPPYSYTTNWISDLGSSTVGVFEDRLIDSPLHTVMNAGFIGAGILLALAAATLPTTLAGPRPGITRALLAAAAAGYVLLGVFHGSPTAAEDGTLALHYTGAALAILGIHATALIQGRRWSRTPHRRGLGHASLALGVMGLLATVGLAATFGTSAPAGLIERIAVYAALAWQLRLAAHLATTRAGRSRPTIQPSQPTQP